MAKAVQRSTTGDSAGSPCVRAMAERMTALPCLRTPRRAADLGVRRLHHADDEGES